MSERAPAKSKYPMRGREHGDKLLFWRSYTNVTHRRKLQVGTISAVLFTGRKEQAMPPTNHNVIITGPHEDLLSIMDKYRERLAFCDFNRLRNKGCLEMSYFADRVVGTAAEAISASYKRVTVAQIAEIKSRGAHWLLIWVVGKSLFQRCVENINMNNCSEERIGINDKLRAEAMTFLAHGGCFLEVSDAK
jgi:hypothetical protein